MRDPILITSSFGPIGHVDPVGGGLVINGGPGAPPTFLPPLPPGMCSVFVDLPGYGPGKIERTYSGEITFVPRYGR